MILNIEIILFYFLLYSTNTEKIVPNHPPPTQALSDIIKNSYFSMYSPFHKTLPKSNLQKHWLSARFYEMGDIQIVLKPERTVTIRNKKLVELVTLTSGLAGSRRRRGQGQGRGHRLGAVEARQEALGGEHG